MSNKNIMTFINAYKKQKEIKAFEKEVKEAGGIEISVARRLVQESNVNTQQQSEMYRMIDNWKQQGFVINDIPEEWDSFRERAKAEGRYAIPKSEWDTMSNEERTKYLSHSQATIYNDSHLEPKSERLTRENLQKRFVDMEVNAEDYKPFYKEGNPILEGLKEE